MTKEELKDALIVYNYNIGKIRDKDLKLLRRKSARWVIDVCNTCVGEKKPHPILNKEELKAVIAAAKSAEDFYRLSHETQVARTKH